MPEYNYNYSDSSKTQMWNKLSADTKKRIEYLDLQREVLTDMNSDRVVDPSNPQDRRQSAQFNKSLAEVATSTPEAAPFLPRPIDPAKLHDEQRDWLEEKKQRLSAFYPIRKFVERVLAEPQIPDSETEIMARLQALNLVRNVKDIADRSGTAQEDKLIQLLADQQTELQESWSKQLMRGDTPYENLSADYYGRVDQLNRMATKVQEAFPHLATEIRLVDAAKMQREIHEEYSVRPISKERWETNHYIVSAAELMKAVNHVEVAGGEFLRNGDRQLSVNRIVQSQEQFQLALRRLEADDSEHDALKAARSAGWHLAEHAIVLGVPRTEKTLNALLPRNERILFDDHVQSAFVSGFEQGVESINSEYQELSPGNVPSLTFHEALTFRQKLQVKLVHESECDSEAYIEQPAFGVTERQEQGKSVTQQSTQQSQSYSSAGYGY